MAGNETEGLRCGAIQTTEKYYLTWREESPIQNPLRLGIPQTRRDSHFPTAPATAVPSPASLRRFKTKPRVLTCDWTKNMGQVRPTCRLFTKDRKPKAGKAISLEICLD